MHFQRLSPFNWRTPWPALFFVVVLMAALWPSGNIAQAIPFGSSVVSQPNRSEQTSLPYYQPPMTNTRAILAVSRVVLNYTVEQSGLQLAFGDQFTVLNRGDGPLTWTSSISESWFSLSPSSGVAPTRVGVNLRLAGLPPGIYTDTIIIKAKGAQNSPQSIDITLKVKSPPILKVKPIGLGFFVKVGDGTLQPQTFDVQNVGGGQLAWTAQESISWLTLEPMSGRAPTKVTATASITGLAPGFYSDTIKISSSNAAGRPKNINVSLLVKKAPKRDNPILEVVPSTLTFSLVDGQPDTRSQLISIKNGGFGPFDWRITEDIAWLTIDTMSGGGPRELTASATTANLTPGVYSGTIKIESPQAQNSPQMVTVTTVVHASASQAKLELSPTSLMFRGLLKRGNPPSRPIRVDTEADTVWAVKSNENWLTVENGSGVGQGQFKVKPNLDQLSPGKYNGKLTVQAGAITAAAMITLSVTDGLEDKPRPDPTVNFVGGNQNSSGQKFTATEGKAILVELSSNPSTGFEWQVDESSLRQASNGQPLFRRSEERRNRETIGDADIAGGVITQLFRFDPLQAGQTTVQFNSVGPPQPNSSRNGRTVNGSFSVDLISTGTFSNVRPPAPNPTPTANSVPPFRGPEDSTRPPSTPRQTRQSQSYFNWCEQGGCTPIRHQGTCGSCWGFATASVLEANIFIKDKSAQDLSEQSLISCNTLTFSNGKTYSCDGGWWAYDHYLNTPLQNTTEAGAIYEAEFGYQGPNAACLNNLTPKEKIASWRYIDRPNGSNLASVEAIKQAMVDYGPIGTSVCVGSAFYKYQAGQVFSTDESAACNGKSNHAVVLVGWDDGQGAWIMRNSWGTGWGDAGYMRIKYGTSNIGYKANYIVYEGNPNATTVAGIPTNLGASYANNQVTLTWSSSSNATGYTIQRLDGNSWQTVDTVDGLNTTSYVDSNVKCGTTYQYRIIATGAGNSSSGHSSITQVETESCGDLVVPTNLTAQSDRSSIKLSWNNPNAAANTEIFRWDGTNQWVQIGVNSAGNNRYSDSRNLVRGQAYYYAVRAASGNESSSYSNQAKGQLSDLALNAPSGLQATSISTSIDLTWKDNSTIESGYIIERWEAATQQWQALSPTTDADAESYTDSNLSCGRRYNYQVRAVADNDSSSYSNMASEVACKATYSFLPLIVK